MRSTNDGSRLPDAGALLRRVTGAREHWARAPRPRGRAIDPVASGEESVWDFPRPPIVESVGAKLRILFAGETIAETGRGRRICETAGAPVYFFPPDDVRRALLVPTTTVTVCEWKGAATYFDLTVGGRTSAEAAFAYPEPFDDLDRGFGEIAGWIAFYASRVDEAWVGRERARPQPGGFYAGWVLPNLRGPIKGAPGSEGW